MSRSPLNICFTKYRAQSLCLQCPSHIPYCNSFSNCLFWMMHWSKLVSYWYFAFGFHLQIHSLRKHIPIFLPSIALVFVLKVHSLDISLFQSRKHGCVSGKFSADRCSIKHSSKDLAASIKVKYCNLWRFSFKYHYCFLGPRGPLVLQFPTIRSFPRPRQRQKQRQECTSSAYLRTNFGLFFSPFCFLLSFLLLLCFSLSPVSSPSIAPTYHPCRHPGRPVIHSYSPHLPHPYP